MKGPSIFKVFLVYQGSKFLVKLPHHIDYATLVRCVKKKFKLSARLSMILLSYKINVNKVSIIDDADLLCFMKDVEEWKPEVKSLFIDIRKEPVKVSQSSSSESLGFDLNVSLGDEPPNPETNNFVNPNDEQVNTNQNTNFEHTWKRNTFNYMPVPPSPPNFVKLPKFQNARDGRAFKVFDEFVDKEECIKDIAVKCIKEGYQYKVVKSCQVAYRVRCKVPECKWYVFNRAVKGTKKFRITSINDVHTCSKTTINSNHCNATSKVLSHMLVPKMRDTSRVYKPKEIQLDFNLAWNIDISYKRAWKGKQLAMLATQGCPKASFEQLPYYFHYLKLANEGTVTHIDTDDAGRFKQCFVAFGAAVRSFLCSLRPLIIIDAAHLKGRYLGTNLAAVGMDGNNQIIPIATGVTQGETGETWSWFLTKLKECIGEVSELAIISDRHYAISLACKNVFPNAFHGFCCRHMMMNANMQSDSLKNLYWKTCKAYTTAEFDMCVCAIRATKPEAYKTLEEAGFEKWSRAYCPANRYNYMTSNSVESINALTKEVRRVPITMLMDWYRSLLQRWYFERRAKYEDAMEEEISDWATSKVHDRIIKSVNWTVKGIDKMKKYEVKDNRRGHVVDLTEGTCTCRKWDLSGLPCGHVCAVARVAGLTSVQGLVQPWFFRITLKKTYEGLFNPVEDVSQWEAPDDLQTVLPPVIVKRQAGRPKKKDRIRSQGEEPKRKQCTRCGATGHDRGSCSMALVTKKRCPKTKLRSLKDICGGVTIGNENLGCSTTNQYLTNEAHHDSNIQTPMNERDPASSNRIINRLSQLSTPQNFLV